jgi:Mg-chelatase subunit ChlD
MRKAYDPDAFNTVVLFTDGRNEDADGPSLASTLAQLTRDAKANPGQRVQIVGIAMGPDADLEALEELADATGGEAYRANSPEALQTVLFDALANRVR